MGPPHAAAPQPTIPPPQPVPRRARLGLPPLGCDAHCHVFGPHARFPYAHERTFTPHDVPKERLAALHAHLGFERAVIVQSACHGTDHGALLDALRPGGGRYRGVALLGPTATADDVAVLHGAGVRGARFSFLPHLGGYPAEGHMRHVERLVEPYGWHLAMHVTGADLVACYEQIRTIRVPVVTDHMARVDVRQGLSRPGLCSAAQAARKRARLGEGERHRPLVEATSAVC